MLVAYIDEIGEPGAFVSRKHKQFNTSAAFGYAGFVLPENVARKFGATFTHTKRTLFQAEVADHPNPGQFEKKGADLFRARTDTFAPDIPRVFRSLAREIRRLDGALFFYADEKQVGTPRQVGLDREAAESAAMQETLNRLCRYADSHGENIMVMIDQINENEREKRLPNMYGHILRRVESRPEMVRIIEPPMHVDSILSANIQYADWVAAFVGRAIDYHLLDDSPYKWVTKVFDRGRNVFTYESKLRLWNRSVRDIENWKVIHPNRPLHYRTGAQRIGDIAPQLHQVHAASVKANSNQSNNRPPTQS